MTVVRSLWDRANYCDGPYDSSRGFVVAAFEETQVSARLAKAVQLLINSKNKELNDRISFLENLARKTPDVE